MTRIAKRVAALISFSVLVASTASAQVIDLSTMKCKEFLDSDKETIGYIMMWLDGYYTDEGDPALVDFSAINAKGAKLSEYCVSNPTTGVLTAAEEIVSK
jgi:acid stress chaperone HdeB